MKLTREGKVARRVEEDNIRAQYVQDEKAYQLTSLRTSWFESNEKQQAERRHRIDEHSQKEELIQANKELVLLRRARLKEFLTAEAIATEQQLNAIGLSFVKDRF